MSKLFEYFVRKILPRLQIETRHGFEPIRRTWRHCSLIALHGLEQTLYFVFFFKLALRARLISDQIAVRSVQLPLLINVDEIVGSQKNFNR